MTIAKVFFQLMLALLSAGIANVLVPRQMPGKAIGSLVVGFGGVLLGEWLVRLLAPSYNLGVLAWEVAGVPVIPAVLCSTVVLYVITLLFGEQRYGGHR